MLSELSPGLGYESLRWKSSVESSSLRLLPVLSQSDFFFFGLALVCKDECPWCLADVASCVSRSRQAPISGFTCLISVSHPRIKRWESSGQLYQWLKHDAQVVSSLGLFTCEEWLLFSNLWVKEQL